MKASFTLDAFSFIELGENISISHGTVVVCEGDRNTFEPSSVLRIGNGTYIGELNNIRASGGGITIGANVLISQGVSLIASNHSFDGKYDISKQKWNTTRTGISIGDGAWIGCNSVILPGVEVGTGAIVGAGSVVTKNIPPYSVAVGNPAKVIKVRDHD